MISKKHVLLSLFTLLPINIFTNQQTNLTTFVIPGFWSTPGTILIQTYNQIFIDPFHTYPIILPEHTIPKKSINRIIATLFEQNAKKHFNKETDFGQSEDSQAIQSQITATVEPNEPFLLFGSCKGAATIINYIANYNPSSLQAVILEAPFSDALTHSYNFFYAKGFSQKETDFIFKRFFSHYPKNPIPPIDAIQYIKNKSLPILIIHSKNDHESSITHSYMLYKMFKEHEFSHVYLAILEGTHGHLITENNTEYLTAIHTFYKHHNLPYSEIYAKDIDQYNHDIKTLDLAIDDFYQKLEQKHLASQKKLSKLMKELLQN